MTEESASTEVPIIKKRSNRPVQQRRRDDDHEEGNNDEEELDRNKLKDLKLLQQNRQKPSGVSVEELVRGDKKSDKSNQNSDDLKTILGNQFNSRMDYGFQQDIPHAKLMEDYIEEKLGLKKDDKVAKKSGPDDELYKVPEDLKFDKQEVKVGTVKVADEEGVASSWSTGIAEVALPVSYKMKNIERTEQLTKELMAKQERGYLNNFQSGSGYQRFQIDSSFTSSVLPGSIQLDQAVIHTELNQNQKRPLKSTDDVVADRFKKRVYDRI